ncbi:hypothetical protein FJTKL_14340 [Diaporthe vaccinii]|uniref:Uncharacterized protein n=1 Tax=Diaporthe vaccinii TaxID=105482 RepID=A0ABR4E865_9PEZI
MQRILLDFIRNALQYFSRYAKNKRDYIISTVSVYWITGVLVCLGGLFTTAACQKIYGNIWWNPADLLMVMMDHGEGSSASRAGVFFLALAFAFTSMFENVCSNAVAGGIDLAGLFPRYIDIRRGALNHLLRRLGHPALAADQPGRHLSAAASTLTFVLEEEST